MIEAGGARHDGPRFEDWHSWLEEQERAILGVLTSNGFSGSTMYERTAELFETKQEPIALTMLQIINSCRKGVDCQDLENQLRTANLMASIEVRSQDLVQKIPVFRALHENAMRERGVTGAGFGFRRMRVGLLIRQWLVLYFLGLRYDRLIEAALRMLNKGNALPAGVTTVVLFGREVERARHALATDMTMERTPPLDIVSNRPLLGSASLPLEDERKQKDPCSFTAEFFYFIQLRLLCDVAVSKGVQGGNYWCRSEDGALPNLGHAFRERLIARQVPEMGTTLQVVPCGVFGARSGIALVDHAAFEWDPLGLDWSKPYSARYISDREITQAHAYLRAWEAKEQSPTYTHAVVPDVSNSEQPDLSAPQ